MPSPMACPKSGALLRRAPRSRGSLTGPQARGSGLLVWMDAPTSYGVVVASARLLLIARRQWSMNPVTSVDSLRSTATIGGRPGVQSS